VDGRPSESTFKKVAIRSLLDFVGDGPAHTFSVPDHYGGSYRDIPKRPLLLLRIPVGNGKHWARDSMSLPGLLYGTRVFFPCSSAPTPCGPLLSTLIARLYWEFCSPSDPGRLVRTHCWLSAQAGTTLLPRLQWLLSFCSWFAPLLATWIDFNQLVVRSSSLSDEGLWGLRDGRTFGRKSPLRRGSRGATSGSDSAFLLLAGCHGCNPGPPSPLGIQYLGSSTFCRASKSRGSHALAEREILLSPFPLFIL